ncbi:serine carboxypeptidase [Cooperia oncophora]
MDHLCSSYANYYSLVNEHFIRLGKRFDRLLNCSVEANPIGTLPGSPPTNFKQYSGYLTVGTKKQIFYWFVESQHNPSGDPLVLWLSGGPGCSGIASLLTEWGPFMVNDDGKTLRKNPYSWNTKASVLTMDSPGGVGYSYADNGYIDTDDDQTAKENWEFLVEFFKKFPQYQRNDLYIIGESYGGSKGFLIVFVDLSYTEWVKREKAISLGEGGAQVHACVAVAIDCRLLGTDVLALLTFQLLIQVLPSYEIFNFEPNANPAGIYAFTLGQKILEMQRYFHMNIEVSPRLYGCRSDRTWVEQSVQTSQALHAQSKPIASRLRRALHFH